MKQIFVRGVDATHVLDVNDSDTVRDLKVRVCALEGVELEQVSLFNGGSPLANDGDLLDALHGLTIDLVIPLKGGKVHGSLARAGKVKGQTPKVEKQEKKKKRTGRAKRRMQYNRRFVNVVQSFGRKRGPNSHVS